MVDPAVGYAPDEGYGAFDRGTAADIWLKAANGSSPFLGAVWPGVTVYPGEYSLTEARRRKTLTVVPRLVQREDPRVLDAMLPFYTDQYGNPHSRTHSYGWEAEKGVDEARKVRRNIQ